MRRAGTLGVHHGPVGRIAWSPDGRLIAAPDASGRVVVWDVATGQRVHELRHRAGAAVDFHPDGSILASVGDRGVLRLWDLQTGKMTHEVAESARADVAFSPDGRALATPEEDGQVRLRNGADGSKVQQLGRLASFWCVAFDPAGALLACGSSDSAIHVWAVADGKWLYGLYGQASQTTSPDGHGAAVRAIAFHPDGRLASASEDRAIKIWDLAAQRLLRTIEGHTGTVNALSFMPGGAVLASAGSDGSVRLWDAATGESLAVVFGRGDAGPGLACHPRLARLACVARSAEGLTDSVIELLDVDIDELRGQSGQDQVTYTSAKIVLVGDSGVGKTGLGWRLTHDDFVEHASTHGQQFWLLDVLGTTRDDGAQCEAVLWDLAGQQDYRLIHALFLDDADLALIVFDPTLDEDPLRGVDFWLRQLGTAQPSSAAPARPAPQAILVAARDDRGAARLTTEEIDRFCEQRGVRSFVSTSAREGRGLERLLADMRRAIDWDARPATVTSQTFKQIKDYVLGLKERADSDRVILSPEELRDSLRARGIASGFSDAEMLSALGHLSNHGYVTRLTTSKGEPRVLLAPELLNNIASSIVLDARRNPRGLGSLEEEDLLAGRYRPSELEALSETDRDVLLDAVIVRFLDRNICFRQTDPLTSRVYLVFPGLINMRKPSIDGDPPVEDGVAYTARGSVQNLYASLVVLLGYTATFTRTNQWRDHARYVVGQDMICGFRLEAEREGEVDFVLYFGTSVGAPIRTLFQSLFESFLAGGNLEVGRFTPVICANGHQLNRSAVREQVAKRNPSMFCPDCGERATIPSVDAPIALSDDEAADLRDERQEVAQRSRFERALFRLNAYVKQERVAAPSCFVSYPWGDAADERWVEVLAHDLVKAGIEVILDRWENDQIGSSVPRFVERIATSDRVLVVGTPGYRAKYDNGEPMGGFVVAAEGDLIGERMLGSEDDKLGVLPLLLKGTKKESFPALLHSRVFADVRDPDEYFARVLGIALSLYRIKAPNPVVAELKRALEPDAG
jgi:small GTP-binding protein